MPTVSEAPASRLSSARPRSVVVAESPPQLRSQTGEVVNRIAALESAMITSSMQVNASMAENAILRAQIEWLRNHQESDWALGLTDELPPSYPGHAE